MAEGISDINFPMVEDGQAFAYRQCLDACDARDYLDAALAALASSLMAQHRVAAVTAAARSGPMPKPRCCSARGTAIWTATAVGKPVNRCAD